MEITESVLTSVKKLLGIDEGYTHFDADIVMHINSVFSILTQMGVGPANGFSITGKDEGWSDFISGGAVLPLVKSYVGLKVRLLFDPPLSSAAVESMNRQINEFEWRLFVAADPVEPTSKRGTYGTAGWMSDKEMRDQINRELLERQYNQLFAEVPAAQVSKGREALKTTLEVAGSVLAIGSSALGIALAIKELKG